MGSRGTGGFSNNTGQSASQGGGNGGSSGKDRCLIEKTVDLEDVGRCSYFVNQNHVPNPGAKVTINFNSIRLEVVDLGGLVVGYLPMELHYLVECMSEGNTYSAGIMSSRNTPTPSVKVHIKSQ